MSRVENADRLLDDVVRAMDGQRSPKPLDAPTFFVEFLPISRHLRALDPQVRLVIGDKGAGKTRLFQALKFPEGRALLSKMAVEHGHLSLPLDRLSWLIGFETAGTNFPPPAAFSRMKGRGAGELRTLWLALLAGALDAIPGPPSAGLRSHRESVAVAMGAWDLAEVVRLTGAQEGQVIAAIDQLDQQLLSGDRHVAVVYDDLDRVSPGDWEVVQSIVQGLTQLWATYSRRWQRIRCKIFLRRDIFERVLRAPDITKIAWNPADLFWSAGELYQLLFKRLANSSDELRSYIERGQLGLSRSGLLGWSPVAREEDDFAQIVKHMFAEHIGSDPTKGVTLRWVPNHLKDGHGRLFPRPLLQLVQDAAEIEKRDREATAPHLIHRAALRGSLDNVSRHRVAEIVDELPWIEHLQKLFEAAPPFQVPAERKLVLRSLEIDWPAQQCRPPETEPDRLLDYLVELGIASVRSNGLIDVGDLYLKGLHLRRRGGVARPKAP